MNDLNPPSSAPKSMKFEQKTYFTFRNCRGGCVSIKICFSFLSWFALKGKLSWYYNKNSSPKVLRTEWRTPSKTVTFVMLNLRRFRNLTQFLYCANINKEWIHRSWSKRSSNSQMLRLLLDAVPWAMVQKDGHVLLLLIYDPSNTCVSCW